MLGFVPMKQLRQLAKPFPQSVQMPAPGGFGGVYVPWSVKAEKVLATLGPFSWEIVQQIHDADGTLTGLVGRLTVTVDGQTVSVDGCGDIERHDIVANNGTRAKHCESDAFSRAASKLGCGLHLWSGSSYRLDRALERMEADK